MVIEIIMEDTKPVIQVSRARHGGHRERIFTEPVMQVLLEQLGLHYYKIRDHIEKPQTVVSEIADTINAKIPGLNLLPMQVYGRMINLQNTLRRYWESVSVGDYKKKPRYYDMLCKVFGTENNAAGAIRGEEYISSYKVTQQNDDLDGGSPNHITVELPEFFDATTLENRHYTMTTSSGAGPSTITTNEHVASRDDVWTPALTRTLMHAMEECLDMLRSRAEKVKAWKLITSAVNIHCESNPLTMYQVKVKVKRMIAAVRKYERQAARGQLFVDKPFYYDFIRTVFWREIRQYHGASPDENGEHSSPRHSGTAGPSSLGSSMQSFMRRTTAMLEESLQIQREMREEMRDYHSKIIEQLRNFNETYRMVAIQSIGSGARKRKLQEAEEEEYEVVEELMADDQSDLEEGIVEHDEFDEMHVTANIL
ncbi:uncharacterized protein LOC108676986 isoform X2 [Hyalella azteca]|uniref:Uncharacterized protein LOC108676986 isoform X2 n=1 Tax=Hyalella azteca TaxID=294128 RepID=A0A8B7P3C6_HYAAZ|nr:uncharacterized protein LOC108676986 isoform X2 [Hyalella azteca]